MNRMRVMERVGTFIRHELVRKTAILQIGGVMGTIVQAVAGVLLARLLRPELYGRYALAFSVASISSVFIGGGLVDAVAPVISRAWARGDRQAIGGAVGFYVRFVAACAAVTLVLIALLPTITSYLYRDGAIGGYAAVIVIASIISVSMFALVQLVLQVAGRIRTLAALTLTDVIVRYCVMLILVALGLGIWGAVAGHLIGALVVMVISVAVYLGVERSHALVPRFLQFAHLAAGASWRPLLKPTLWVLADSNFALLYGALPVAMVGLYASPSELAYFKLAFGYIVLAMSAMGPISTVMNVHFPTLQATAPDRLRSTFLKVTAAAVAISAVLTMAALAVSPLVFRVLYGIEYAPAVPYVYGFGVFGALFGLGAGLGPLWRALGKVRVSIFINLIVLGAGIPGGLWLIRHWHLWGAVAMTTLWYSVSHLISFMYLARTLKRGR